MKKLFFLVLSFCFLSGLVFVPSIFAQASQSERWVCLDAVKAGDAFKQTLKAKANEKGRPLPSTATYIVECVATNKGQICTTGRQDADQTVYKKSNLDELTATGQFTYNGMYLADGKTNSPNPLISDSTGGVNDIIWHAHSGHLDRKFFALNYYTPGGTGAAGEVGALQQATFTFEQASMAKDCAAIHWDPYGRVFDSQTLEPITSAVVTLLFKKNDVFVKMTPADILGGNLKNPQITAEDGNFSFVVPDGDYKLTVSPPLQFVSALSQVNSGYSKAYSDIYPFVSSDVDGVIQERGVIQHRDIPIKTVNSTTPVKMMDYFYEADPTTGNATIEGVVSHPFTKLVAKSVKVSAADPTVKTPYREIGTATADKMGRFYLKIDQNKLEKTADYVEIFSELEMIKVDMRTMVQKENTFIQKMASFFNTLFPVVLAQGTATSIHFEPIPQYLEGYAYVNGIAIPNTTVEVYKTMSNKAYSTTKADQTGYFKITSEYLPTDPYDLHYITPQGAVIKKTISEFIAVNQKLIVQNKIDLYSYRDQKNRTIKDMIKPTLPTSNGGGRNPLITGQNDITKQQPINTANIPYIGIIVILLILIVVTIVVVVIMMKKKPPTERMIQ